MCRVRHATRCRSKTSAGRGFPPEVPRGLHEGESPAEQQPARRAAPICINVIGAGATGVELAAALRCDPATDDVPLQGAGVRARRAHPVDRGGPRILPALDERLSGKMHAQLRALNVDVLTDTRVAEVGADAVTTSTGERLASDITIWAAGVAGPAFLRQIGDIALNRSNQVIVTDTLQTPDDPHVYAFGDCAACPTGGANGFAAARVAGSRWTASRSAMRAPSCRSGMRAPYGRHQRAFALADRRRLAAIGLYQVPVSQAPVQRGRREACAVPVAEPLAANQPSIAALITPVHTRDRRRHIGRASLDMPFFICTCAVHSPRARIWCITSKAVDTMRFARSSRATRIPRPGAPPHSLVESYGSAINKLVAFSGTTLRCGIPVGERIITF